MAESAVHHTSEIQERCSRGDVALARAFGILGKRWSGLVVGSLSRGPAGFRELSRLVEGVSDSVLSDRLTELCDVGLVKRDVDPGPPVGVAYSLTAAGEALLPALNMIADWADTHLPEPPTSC